MNDVFFVCAKLKLRQSQVWMLVEGVAVVASKGVVEVVLEEGVDAKVQDKESEK